VLLLLLLLPLCQLLTDAVGSICTAGLVRHAFRTAEGDSSNLDDGFRALRMLHSVERWVTSSAPHEWPEPSCLLPPPNPSPTHHVPHAAYWCALRRCTDNELWDSLEGLSDREAPASESTSLVVAQLMARS
jgi:hypothetical protein